MTTPTELGAELLATIARLNRWATRHAELPIPPAQARLLAQIEELGAARIGDLARADHCSQPTMTTQVQRLEQQGWAERTTDPADGRAVLISLTPEGSSTLREVRRSRAAVMGRIVEQLDSDQRSRLDEARNALDALLAAAGRDDQEREDRDVAAT